MVRFDDNDAAVRGLKSLKSYCIPRESPQAHLHVVGMLRFMFGINQPSLPTPFDSFLVSISVLFFVRVWLF